MNLRQALQEASAIVAGELQRLDTGRSRWALLREPERRKYVHRLHDALADLERIDEAKPISDQAGLRSALTRLASHKKQIPNDELWAILNEAQLARIRHGDAETVCALIENELQWHKGQTSWLTWDALYADGGIPPAVVQYRAGGPIDPRALASARNELLSMYRSRHDDEVARRARGEERAKNLQVLAILLALLLSTFVIVYGLADGGDEWEEFAVLISAGGAGAAISGTIKARDRLTRQGDIHRFRDALPAQLLVGAATAVFVYLLFRSDIITFGNVDLETDEARAAIAFLAGFSEPWVLRTIERATQVGSPKGPRQ
jgi:hypothetical protein